MQASYGSFTHPANEVTLASVSVQRLRNQRGIVNLTRKRIQLLGVYVLDTSGMTSDQAQADIKSAIAARESAYSIDGKDFYFRHDNGTVSAHSLQNSTSIGGVRVIDRNFPSGNGVEYATQRTFSISLEADYDAGSENLQAFQETIEVVGTGGPRKITIETLNGPPQRQITHQKTKVTMVQRGQAIGLYEYPIADLPAPVAPEFEDEDRRSITLSSPQNQNGAFINWTINWAYYFTLDQPSGATPNFR